MKDDKEVKNPNPNIKNDETDRRRFIADIKSIRIIKKK